MKSFMEQSPEECEYCGELTREYWTHIKTCKARAKLIKRFKEENKFPSTY